MYHHKQVFLLVAYLPFVQLQIFFAWIWAIIVHISMFSFIYIYVCLPDSSISQIQVHWCDVGKVNFQPLQVNHLQGGSDHRPVKLDVLSSCLNGLHYVSDLELIVGVNRLWGRCIFHENGLALFPLKDWYCWTSLHFSWKSSHSQTAKPQTSRVVSAESTKIQHMRSTKAHIEHVHTYRWHGPGAPPLVRQGRWAGGIQTDGATYSLGRGGSTRGCW